MLTRAHLGAHLAAVSLGRLDVAEHHLREARRLVIEHGAYDRWGHLSVGRAEADLAMRRGAPEAMALAADHLRSELEDGARASSEAYGALVEFLSTMKKEPDAAGSSSE